MPFIDTVDYSKSLPSFWTEEDKIEYELLKVEAKKIFPKTDDYVIHIAIEAWMNNMKGMKRGCTDEEIKEVMKKYDNKSLVLETPKDDDFDMEKTMLKKTEIIKETLDEAEEQPKLENNLYNIIEDIADNEILQTT